MPWINLDWCTFALIYLIYSAFFSLDIRVQIQYIIHTHITSISIYILCTHTHKLCFIWHGSWMCIESLAGCCPGTHPLECQWRPVFLKGSWPWKQAFTKYILLTYLPSPSPLPHKCFQSKGHFYDFRNFCCLSLLAWILVSLLFGKCEVQYQYSLEKPCARSQQLPPSLSWWSAQGSPWG